MTKMIKPFRATYSILSAWDKGDYKGAIKSYYKLETYTNKYMEMGKKYHKKFENEINETGCRPEIFGGKKLVNPVAEEKLEIDLLPWLQLVGVVDCRHGKNNIIVEDYKTGTTPLNDWLSSKQLPLYAVLLMAKGYNVNQGRIYKFNQYSREVEVGVLWISKTLIQDTVAWLIKTANDMVGYIEEHGLENKYGHIRDKYYRDRNEADILSDEDLLTEVLG